MEERIAGSSSLGTASLRQMSNACAKACVPILNQHVVQYSYTCSKRCNGEHRSLISSVPKRMCFLWRQELIKRRRSPQHTLKNRSVCCWKIDDDMNSTNDPAILARTPYDFYGGENCKVVGTLHNIVDSFLIMWLDYQWFDSCDSILRVISSTYCKVRNRG
jgi:hypothetical protein